MKSIFNPFLPVGAAALVFAAWVIASGSAGAQAINVPSSQILDSELSYQIHATPANTIPVNGAATFDGLNEFARIGLFQFSGLSSLTAGQSVSSATLHLFIADGLTPNPIDRQFEIVGLTAAFNTTTATYDNFFTTASTNGVVLGYTPLGIGGADGTAFNLDITAFLDGYLKGTYTGLAIRDVTVEPADNTILNYASTEHATAAWRPTLDYTVVAVPEPSAALLGAIGGLVLFRRRRA